MYCVIIIIFLPIFCVVDGKINGNGNGNRVRNYNVLHARVKNRNDRGAGSQK